MEKTGVLGENHWPVANHWQTLSHNFVSSTPKEEFFYRKCNLSRKIKICRKIILSEKVRTIVTNFCEKGYWFISPLPGNLVKIIFQLWPRIPWKVLFGLSDMFSVQFISQPWSYFITFYTWFSFFLSGKNLKFDNFSWFKWTVHAIKKSQIFKVIIFIVTNQ